MTNPAGPRAATTVGITAQAGSEPPGEDFAVVRFADAGHAWAATGDDLYVSADGGQHWRRQYQGSTPFRALDPLTPEVGWVQTDQALLATSDGGRSWQAVSSSGFSTLDHVRFVDRQDGWASVQETMLRTGAVLHSGDGGRTWQPVTTPCGGPAATQVADFLDRTMGWLICGGQPGAGNQEKWLYQTTDGGQHWQLVAHTGFGDPAAATEHRLTLGGYVSDLSFVDAQHGWLLLARGGLFSTGDGGRSWTHLPLVQDGGPALSIAGYNSPSAGDVLVAGNPSVLLATRDGGASWVQVVPTLRPDGR